MYFPKNTEQFSTQISSLHFLTDSLYHSEQTLWEYFFYAFQAPCQTKPIWPNVEMKKWILGFFAAECARSDIRKQATPARNTWV